MDDDKTRDEALIHLRVSQSRKGDWVKRSRAEGKKLADWIIDRVEREVEGNEGKPVQSGG